MNQPTALRLADLLEMGGLEPMTRVAAELRRLHAENKAFSVHLSARMTDLAKVEAQRDALLEALRPFVTIGSGFDMEDVRKGRAAIAAVEDKT